MKKLVTVLAVGALFISCEKSELHEETSEIIEFEIHQTAKRDSVNSTNSAGTGHSNDEE